MTSPRRPRPTLVVSDLPGMQDLMGASEVVSADQYISGEGRTLDEGLTVVNLCRSYHYLSRGYYVSLLGEARHHRIIPSLETVQAITDPFVYFRMLREAGLETIDYRIARGGRRLLPRLIVPDPAGREPDIPQQALIPASTADDAVRYERIQGTYQDVTSVLGRTTQPEFRRVASAIFRTYPVPLLRIRLYWDVEDEAWLVGQIYPIAYDALDPEHVALLIRELATDRLRRAVARVPDSRPFRIACLFDARDPHAPSDEATLDRFSRAAERHGALFEVIDPEDLPRLAEFDALLIRTVTAIDHYSFTFSRTAESLDIPVIDAPGDIMRCSNKVYLHELFQRHGLPTPRTVTISRKTPVADIMTLGFPVILKQPDGTFSGAVKKAADEVELTALRQELSRRSPLLIAQEFVPTAFDWRIGILDGRLLFAAKYHMVKDHWQIVGQWKTGRTRYGKVDAVPLTETPPHVTSLALEAAGLIGDGLYGVDIKDTSSGALIIEINDNPNIVEGDEDAVERDHIYDAVITTLLNRIRTPRESSTLQ